ncbi:MAG TPA: cysteine--tRNA ligase, partial [Gemmatimonadaceae bacterium]|nr:cysteine--tRNA ligase [Gemmatimonadaceae bacterium]
MTELRLYNSLSRTIEPFAPADGKSVRMYTCGPTVYNPAHIGNFRTFLFEDLLRRVLRLNGWDVIQVMNLTDVDDKIIKRAFELKKTITQVTEPITEIFHADRRYLRIEDAEEYPKATAHIPEMIALVQTLLDKKIAYVADDKSVYFAIDRFPQYGRLSRLDTREIKTGARVAQDDYSKENAQDFALWKAAKAEDEATGAAWDAPFGRGRPGWHLECSAMAMKYLGETLDIHCGGVDLVFPHHEDEIAQSEAATGKPFSRIWCHGEFLLIDGTKMAKRVGNVANVQDLRDQGISAAAVRHFVFSTHYRKQINLSGAALEASLEAVRRVGEFKHRLDSALGGTTELADAALECEQAVRAALNDDLNAPEAVAAVFAFVQRGNAELDRRGTDEAALMRARQAFATVDAVLDIVPEVVRIAVAHDGSVTAERPKDLAKAVDSDIEWALARLAERRAKRAARDFAAADALRQEVESRGFAVKDTGH